MANTAVQSGESQKEINPLSIGVMGTALGVALGATTVVLSDKQNRKKMIKTVAGITKQTVSAVDAIKKKTAGLYGLSKGRNVLTEKKNKIKKAARG